MVMPAFPEYNFSSIHFHTTDYTFTLILFERQNIQKDNSQTIHKNRTCVPHNLQPPAPHWLWAPYLQPAVPEASRWGQTFLFCLLRLQFLMFIKLSDCYL